MKFTAIALALCATTTVTARRFFVWEHSGWSGQSWIEDRPNDGRCWDMGDHGRKASSISDHQSTGTCTVFFNQRGCTGASWSNKGFAKTVPSFLNDNIWSYRNCQ
ncbi:hypothetical protein M011DRAFT_477173 [Sporormia fimetaria CBS 119925]|uniref:Uncharacterized protein n=1 Tax=Sporormia fimetaria CBS 119925 TaxID=1340428 RepID=A0A6A6VCU7_9PLEO|nr:hypothetical protein M011DRAFT_477173 [Sporormia fimetaria CBS 119925]